jgi:RNA polymerase sigma factor (sigma-70 family)
MCDTRLIEQAIKDFKSGKKTEESFALIDKCYRHRLIRFFASQGFSPDKQEDLTQNVFLRVYQHVAGFRGGDSITVFETWLFRIADHIGLDDHRKGRALKRNKGETLSLDGEGDDNQARESEADSRRLSARQFEALKVTEERIQWMKKVLESLPEQERECMYHSSQGWNIEEIAILMGKPVNTVKSLLYRSKQKLIAKAKADGLID